MSDHDGIEDQDWYEKGRARRIEEFGQRITVLRQIVEDVRLHRMQDCEGYPLCPGAAAAEKLNMMHPSEWGDFLSTCLAALADKEGEVETLRVRLADKTDALAFARTELAKAVKEKDAGWEAYRSVTAPAAAPEEQP